MCLWYKTALPFGPQTYLATEEHDKSFHMIFSASFLIIATQSSSLALFGSPEFQGYWLNVAPKVTLEPSETHLNIPSSGIS